MLSFGITCSMRRRRRLQVKVRGSRVVARLDVEHSAGGWQLTRGTDAKAGVERGAGLLVSVTDQSGSDMVMAGPKRVCSTSQA